MSSSDPSPDSELFVDEPANSSAEPYRPSLLARKNTSIFVAAAIGGLLFGYDTGVISSALLNIQSDIDGAPLSSTKAEWVTASLSAGALLGGLCGGAIVDTIGRKNVLGIADVVFVIGAVLIAASYSLSQLIFGRCILGIAVGITASITPLYLGEIAPAKIRGAVVAIYSLMITSGQVIAYIFGALFTFRGAWRALFALSIFPALIQAFMIHTLPESPRYHLLKGNVEMATRSLSAIYNDPSPEQTQNMIHSIKSSVKLSRTFQDEYSLLQRLFILATRPSYRKPAIIAVTLMLFQQLSGFNSLMYYSATIFKYAGFNNGAATGIIVAATNFVFTCVSMWFMDRVGKRRMLLYSIPGMVFGLALSAVSFHYLTLSTGGKLIDGSTYPAKWAHAMLGTMVIYIASYALGLGTIPWQCVEMFPLEVRGLGAAAMNSANWSGNLVVSATFLSLMDRTGASWAFGIYAIICACGFLYTERAYPELSGRTLEEIREIF